MDEVKKYKPSDSSIRKSDTEKINRLLSNNKTISKTNTNDQLCNDDEYGILADLHGLGLKQADSVDVTSIYNK